MEARTGLHIELPDQGQAVLKAVWQSGNRMGDKAANDAVAWSIMGIMFVLSLCGITYCFMTKRFHWDWVCEECWLPKWEISNLLYLLLFRGLILLFMVVSLTEDIIATTPANMKFFTYWNFFFLTCYFAASFFITLHLWMHPGKSKPLPKTFVRFVWIVGQVLFSCKEIPL